MEIIKPFDGSHVRVAVFDYDGTLSDKRHWIDSMVSQFVGAIMQECPTLDPKDVIKDSLSMIIENTGKPTYFQMESLNEYINSHEGRGRGAMHYKSINAGVLDELVRGRELQNDPADMNIPGSVDFLKNIRPFIDKIYIATGSDEDRIIECAEKSGFSPYVDCVRGARMEDPHDCAKAKVIDDISYGLKDGELIVFEDAFPGIVESKKDAGIAIGLLTEDVSSYPAYFSVDRKRDNLIDAGADALIPDYTEPGLVDKIFGP